MKHPDDLRWYTIPPLPADWSPPWTLIDQLNVFAGQLYLSNFTAYTRLCRFLGVHTEASPESADNTVVKRNWFSNHNAFTAEIKNRFSGTPLPLAMLLLAVRRGMGFARTHMGRIFDGWPLTEEDFGERSYFVDSGLAICPRPFQSDLELGMPADLLSVDEGDEKGTTLKRARDLESESAGNQWKRRRLTYL